MTQVAFWVQLIRPFCSPAATSRAPPGGRRRRARSFAAPTEPGDYLINVAAQLGGVDRIYREFDTAFLFLLRVVAG